MEKICKICGKTFTPRRRSQLCCSAECSKENKLRLARIRYTAKKTKTPKTSRICIICGKTFTPRQRNYLCCSPECSKENKRRQSLLRRYRFENFAAPKKLRPRIATCLNCGHKFKQTFTNEKFCSDDCRLQYFHKDDLEAVSL